MDEYDNVDKDRHLVQSTDCNNPETLALYSDLAESCAEARRRNQLQFHTRVKEKLVQYGCVFWQFAIDHQPLKLWYLQLCLPIVFVIFLGFRSSYLKEQAKQDAQVKIIRETMEMQRLNAKENREMCRNLFELCEKQQNLQQSLTQIPKVRATPLITDNDDCVSIRSMD